jgi:hypothetical protein
MKHKTGHTEALIASAAARSVMVAASLVDWESSNAEWETLPVSNVTYWASSDADWAKLSVSAATYWASADANWAT